MFYYFSEDIVKKSIVNEKEKDWTCEGCNTNNPSNEYKCSYCKKMNPQISKDFIIRKDLTTQKKIERKPSEKKFDNSKQFIQINTGNFGNQGNTGNPNNNQQQTNNYQNQQPEIKKASTLGNNNNSNLINHHSQNNQHNTIVSNKTECICSTSRDEALFKNGHCKLCKRIVQHQIQHKSSTDSTDNVKKPKNLQESNFTFKEKNP